MCGLRTRPRTDVDPPRFLPPSNCHRRGEYRLIAPCCDISLFTITTWHAIQPSTVQFNTVEYGTARKEITRSSVLRYVRQDLVNSAAQL